MIEMRAKKPEDFNLEEFAAFLRDEIPWANAEYVMGLLSLVKDDE